MLKPRLRKSHYGWWLCAARWELQTDGTIKPAIGQPVGIGKDATEAYTGYLKASAAPPAVTLR